MNLKRLKVILFFLIVMLFTITSSTLACTTFNLNGKGYNLFGRNYDWPCENGMLIINKRGISKTAMRASPNGDDLMGYPAQWTSKYGSVTFNQYGRELPQGGMNEEGLVVESMALRSTSYPKPDSRPFIHRSQWRQYQLDNHKTVDEVIKSDSKIRIFPTYKKWSIVYDINNFKISYRTHSNPNIRYLNLNDIEFSCKTPAQVLNINGIEATDITDKFTEYSLNMNRDLIQGSFKATYKKVFNTDRFRDLMEKVTRYPDSTTCQKME